MATLTQTQPTSIFSEGNFNTPGPGSLFAPKPLSLTPTTIPSSVTSGIQVSAPTVQVPTPGISGATTTAANSLFAPHAPITTPSTPFYSPSSANKGAIAIATGAQTNTSKATPNPVVPASTVGQTNTLTIPTPSPSVTAGTNLGVATNNVVNTLPPNTARVDANGNPIDQNGNPIANTDNSQQTDQYGNPVGTTYNQDGTIAQTGGTGDSSVLGVQTGSPQRSSILNTIQSLLGVQATQPEVSENAYENAGIYDKMNASNDINNQMLTTQRSYDEEAKTIKNNAAGLDVAGVNEQLATLQRQQNEDMANLAIVKSADDNDLATAQAIVDKKLSFQFDPIQNEINNLGNLVQLNNSDLSDSQKTALTVKQYQLQNNLDLLKTAKTSASQYAIQQGITDPSVLQAIDQATTPAEAYQAVEGTGSGTSGLPGGNNIVTGSNGSYDFTGYATDPLKTVKTQGIANVLTQNGAATSPDSLQQYISNTFPDSSITGQMVFDAAQKYGVDPAVLAANMQEESQFGTQGAGAKTNNPNNIGNTDNGNTQSYSSIQDGVNAGAAWLANHQANGDSSSTDQVIPPTLAKQPYTIPQGVTGVPGTAYIDGGRLSQIGTPLQQQAVSRTATAAGIPVLSSDDVQKVRNIDVTKQNLGSMQSQISTLLGSGPVNRIGSAIANTIGAALQSNTAAASWNSYRVLAVNALQSLGAGSGGARITASEIAAAQDNLPTLTDSAETAQNKIDILNGFLDKWTKEILPNAQIGQSSTSTSSSASDPLGLGI